MATVFYTPGLMELVDSLTRDASADEEIGKGLGLVFVHSFALYWVFVR